MSERQEMTVHTMRKKAIKFVLCSLITLGACVYISLQQVHATGIAQILNFQSKVVNSDGTNVTDGTYDFVFTIYNAASSSATTLFTESWTSAALWSSTLSSAPIAGGQTLVYVTTTNQSSLQVGQILTNVTKGEQVVITSVNTGTQTIGISPTQQAWGLTDTITNKIYVKNGIFRVGINSLNQNLSGVDFQTNPLFLGVNFNADGEAKPRIQLTAAPYAFNANTVDGLTFSGTDGNTYTLPTTNSGTIITNNAPSQSITSTQTSGTLLGLSDATAITAPTTGLSITLSGTGAFNQTGLSFNLSGATGASLNDIVGSGSTWTVSKSGAISTSGGITLSAGALAVNSGSITSTGALNQSAASASTYTSTQTSGIVYGVTDTTAITAATTGLSITLSGTGAFNQTGLSFNLSGATGGSLNDIVGSGSTWTVSKAGAISTSGGITVSGGGETISSGALAVNSGSITSTGALNHTAAAASTFTSTQTSGTVLGVSDTTAITTATTGLSVTLSGTGAFNQTGLSFNLSGATGGSLNDVVGTGSTWSISKAGALTTSGGITLSAGALAVNSGSITSSVALTLSTTTGAITLQPAGASTTSSVNIGAGGAGSGTPDLLDLDVKNTSGDPTGTNGAMYYNASTNRFRCFENSTWEDCNFPFTTRQYGEIRAAGSAGTTFNTVRLVAPTLNSPGAAATANPQSDNYYVSMTTGSSSGNIAGLTQAFTQTQARYRPRFTALVRTDSAISNRRIWVALSTAALTGVDTSTTIKFVGVRYSTGAGDSTWQCASGDGTATSVVNTGVTVAASTAYTITVDWSVSGTLTCTVNGTTVSKTNNLVSTDTTNLGLTIANTNLTGANDAFNISWAYLEDQ